MNIEVSDVNELRSYLQDQFRARVKVDFFSDVPG